MQGQWDEAVHAHGNPASYGRLRGRAGRLPARWRSPRRATRTQSRTRRRRSRRTTSSTRTCRCARRSSARAAAGASTGCATPASWRARPRRSSTPSGRSATSRSCARTIATATGSTRSSSTRPGTGACARRSSARSTRSRGGTRSPAAHAVRAALFFVWGQVNSGVMCPVSMTYSAIPALREEPDLAAEWEPRITRPSYDDGALVGMAMTEKQGGSDVRANSTRARPERRRLGDHRPQVVLLVSALRPVPDARAGARRAVLLPDRGPRPGLPDPAAEGQARHALAAVERGGVPRRARAARGRGGPRHPDDHPDGQPHPARLPDRIVGRDALGPRPGRAPRAPPERLREAARGPAADAERAGRPGDRVGGRDRGDDARGARLRRGRRFLPADRHRRDEALRLQARAGARRRGARVPRRERLRRGVRHAAPPARLAAQLDLGGLRQRVGARRAARAREGARGAARVPRRVRAGARRQRGARRAPRPDRATRSRRTRSSRRAAWSRTSRWRSRRACSCGTPRRRSRTPSARRASTRSRGAYGTLPPSVDTEAILARALPA